VSGTTRRALFADLVFNEEGQPANVVDIGGIPHYAVPDGDFLRHVEAEAVDRQIVAELKERILPMKDAIIEGVVHMLGEEELFTRPAIEQAIENMDHILEPGAVDVDELRTALWMTKFRAVVNVHGDLVHLETPGWEGEGYDE
jgi:hypothetical protein